MYYTSLLLYIPHIIQSSPTNAARNLDGGISSERGKVGNQVGTYISIVSLITRVVDMRSKQQRRVSGGGIQKLVDIPRRGWEQQASLTTTSYSAPLINEPPPRLSNLRRTCCAHERNMQFLYVSDANPALLYTLTAQFTSIQPIKCCIDVYRADEGRCQMAVELPTNIFFLGTKRCTL